MRLRRCTTRCATPRCRTEVALAQMQGQGVGMWGLHRALHGCVRGALGVQLGQEVLDTGGAQ